MKKVQRYAQYMTLIEATSIIQLHAVIKDTFNFEVLLAPFKAY